MPRPTIDFVLTRTYTTGSLKGKKYYETVTKLVGAPDCNWKSVKEEEKNRLNSMPSVIHPIRREWTTYAWPGGYELYFVTKDNGVLCHRCANRNFKLTLSDDPQWQIVAYDMVDNFDGEEAYCDNCNHEFTNGGIL